MYSVGFYELIRKVLERTQNNYTIVTDIWKVFQVLLEYCQHSDYKMLIQEISEQQNKAMEEQEAKFKE